MSIITNLRSFWLGKVSRWLTERRHCTETSIDDFVERLEREPDCLEASLAIFWYAYLSNRRFRLGKSKLKRLRKMTEATSSDMDSIREREQLNLARLYLSGAELIARVRGPESLWEDPVAKNAVQKSCTFSSQTAYSFPENLYTLDATVVFEGDLFRFTYMLVLGISNYEAALMYNFEEEREEAFNCCEQAMVLAFLHIRDGEHLFKPYLPHSGPFETHSGSYHKEKGFNTVEAARIFQGIERYPAKIKDWGRIRQICEAIENLSHEDSGCNDFENEWISDSEGNNMTAPAYWGRAATFAKEHERIVASPYPIVTKDSIECVETKERLRRDFLADAWEELTPKAQELLADAEVEWIHSRIGNMLKRVRQLLEVTLLFVCPYLKPTIDQSDSHLILTRMKNMLLSNQVVRGWIEGLRISVPDKVWIKDELPKFLQKVIRTRNYFEKEEYLPGKEPCKSLEMTKDAVSVHSELLGIRCDKGVLPRLLEIKAAITTPEK